MGFYRVSDVKTGGNFLCLSLEVKEDFPCGTFVYPPLPPRPFTPAGVKGSLNTQFGFFGPDRGFDSGRCGAGLFAQIGESRSRSQGLNAWRGCARARSAQRRVQGERSEQAHAVFGTPAAIGRAEQRSGARIRAGACLSVASLRPTPGGASSARHPAGARPLARLFFGYFLLAKQKKVARPQGRNPVFPSFPSKISLSPT